MSKLLDRNTDKYRKQNVRFLNSHDTNGYIDNIIKKSALPRYEHCAGKVVEALVASIGKESLGIDAISEKVGLSKRTLQRRLIEEGTAFSLLRDSVKFHFAVKFFLESSLTVDVLCKKLDFADRSVLLQAFMGWTGLSPREFRKMANGRGDNTSTH